jgi:indolepyruvate ferredoxin oxidoreductase
VVARSLFKLMAYKDEYEVARLHTQTGLQAKLRQEFDGDFKVNYHLAPPLLPSRKDARGRPLKRQFGPWIEPAFRALARLKFLRGTPFDPFGYTRERRMERNLIAWYETLLTELLRLLHAGSVGSLTEIAALPMEIRGYGPVKEAAVEKVKAKVASLRNKG